MLNTVSINFILNSTNHIIIECEINKIFGKFIIDTGASESCINLCSAKKFNLITRKSNEVVSSASDNINETFFSEINLLRIKEIKKKNFNIILFDMSHINNILKDKKTDTVDGILGSDILKEFKAIINYKKKLLTLKF